MSISQDQVVSIHYTLRDEAGEIIDSSPAGEPLAYLHGHGNLVPGLERELAGRSVGDKLTVTLSPADGYGEHDPKLVQQVARRALKGVGNVPGGKRLSASSGRSDRNGTVPRIAADPGTGHGQPPPGRKKPHFGVE